MGDFRLQISSCPTGIDGLIKKLNHHNNIDWKSMAVL
jgi:hypothetical protein